ncbi:HlyD family efflux transporter periplasmic adaptor subunit [Niveibacterium terrae]|uniref:HlyD family efflux transporter periplasmic adaptor subunit n=1 Tax=Niveibacterium terrae TaxID=3373598 RepID=UPI003A8F8A17
MSLFRPEALTAQTDRLHGDIMLARPLAGWVLAWGAAAVAASILAFLFLGHYTKRTTATGVLVPLGGALRILAPAAGVVTELRVHEGEFVRKGQVLAVLADERRLGAGSGERLADVLERSYADKKLSLLREKETTARLTQQSRDALIRRLAQMHVELQQAQRESALIQTRIAYSRKNGERQRQLAAAHFVSEQAVQQTDEELTDLQARLAGAERTRSSLLREIAASEDDLRQLPTRTESQLAEIDRNLATLTQENSEAAARDRYAITAPADGIVTNLLAEVGQSVGNQPLATLLPAGAKLEAQLFLTSRAVGFVEPGQNVRLRYQAYPYQKFGQYSGIVATVSRSQLAAADLPPTLPNVQNAEGLYRISVRLAKQQVSTYGKATPLTAGMLVEADIEQDTRRLIEWVFEPLYSLGGAL